MEGIINFFSETLVLELLGGQRLLELFDQYFLSQTSVNQVLLIVGTFILSFIGATQIVKVILKLSMLWIKVLLFLALAYYLFVVLLGFDLSSLLG